MTATRPTVADLLTLGNAMAGTTAVLVAAGAVRHWDADQTLRAVALLLVVATIFDVLDGVAARRWGGSALGKPLDALADAISFGLAPAVAVATYVLSQPSGTAERLVVAAGALAYVASALLRLARFLAERPPQDHFTGLPTTSAAIVALCIAFLTTSPWVVAVGLFLVAVLMVSLVPYPLQRSARVAGWSVAGWAFGLVGVVGLVDVRFPAGVALVALAAVVPVVMSVRHAAVESF